MPAAPRPAVRGRGQSFPFDDSAGLGLRLGGAFAIKPSTALGAERIPALRGSGHFGAK